MAAVRCCLAIGLAVVLAACGGGGSAMSPATDRQVRVDWLGNDCFRISSSIGTSILTDPYAAGTGGRTLPSPLTPDIVLVSHERPSANNVDAMDNQPSVFRGSVAMGSNSAAGIRILGVPTFRNPDAEVVEGMNIVFQWTMDGVRFTFLGAIVNPLTPAQLSQLASTDVLFVPVGGTLSPAARETILAQIRPRLVIPSGAAAGGWTSGRVISVPGRSVLISRSILPLQTTTLLFGSER